MAGLSACLCSCPSCLSPAQPVAHVSFKIGGCLGQLLGCLFLQVAVSACPGMPAWAPPLRLMGHCPPCCFCPPVLSRRLWRIRLVIMPTGSECLFHPKCLKFMVPPRHMACRHGNNNSLFLPGRRRSCQLEQAGRKVVAPEMPFSNIRNVYHNGSQIMVYNVHPGWQVVYGGSSEHHPHLLAPQRSWSLPAQPHNRGGRCLFRPQLTRQAAEPRPGSLPSSGSQEAAAMSPALPGSSPGLAPPSLPPEFTRSSSCPSSSIGGR